MTLERKKMTPEQKKWIDEASYEDLLRRVRFAPVGDPMFQCDTDYYFKVMDKLKSADRAEHVRASKALG